MSLTSLLAQFTVPAPTLASIFAQFAAPAPAPLVRRCERCHEVLTYRTITRERTDPITGKHEPAQGRYDCTRNGGCRCTRGVADECGCMRAAPTDARTRKPQPSSPISRTPTPLAPSGERTRERDHLRHYGDVTLCALPCGAKRAVTDDHGATRYVPMHHHEPGAAGTYAVRIVPTGALADAAGAHGMAGETHFANIREAKDAYRSARTWLASLAPREAVTAARMERKLARSRERAVTDTVADALDYGSARDDTEMAYAFERALRKAERQ